MPLIEVARLALGATLTVVLVLAGVSDVRSRTIPNRSVLSVLGLFLIWTVANHGAGLVSSLEAAGIALVVTVLLYAFKVFGAGDAKLFSAVALFAGLEHLQLLTIATAITGGVIGAVSLASRPTRALTMITLRGAGDYGRGIPYGVAISTGGVVTIWTALTLLIHQS